MAEICKKRNIPLIVDEAHGSLWNYSDELPVCALELGADAVVHSLHKTGGAMTQASMLHISKIQSLMFTKLNMLLNYYIQQAPQSFFFGKP